MLLLLVLLLLLQVLLVLLLLIVLLCHCFTTTEVQHTPAVSHHLTPLAHTVCADKSPSAENELFDVLIPLTYVVQK